ncbi:unnamed protein product, partial [marine sediment metagenome]
MDEPLRKPRREHRALKGPPEKLQPLDDLIEWQDQVGELLDWQKFAACK